MWKWKSKIRIFLPTLFFLAYFVNCKSVNYEQIFFRHFMLAMLDWANIDTWLMKWKVEGANLKELEKQIWQVSRSWGTKVPVDPWMVWVSQWGQHQWISRACQVCAKSTGAQIAICCLTGSWNLFGGTTAWLSKGCPEMGEGLLTGAALLNPSLVLPPGVAHAIMCM